VAVSQGAGGDAGVQVGFLRNGKIIGSEFFQMDATLEDELSTIVAVFIQQFYEDAAIVPPRLILQHPVPESEREMFEQWLAGRRGGKVQLHVPQRGNQRGLVGMVAKSADENLEQTRLKFLSDEMKMTAAMTELAEALDLPRMPRRIECYDNS